MNGALSSNTRTRFALLARLLAIAALFGLGVSGLVSGLAHAQDTSNLLAGRTPSRSNGIDCEECLTDGRAPFAGSFWKTHATARFKGQLAYAVFDLGAEQRISAFVLQGDNNDTYEVGVSNDGLSFEPAWRAIPVERSGLQPRQVSELNVVGRYLKISASGGDGSYAIGEVQAFSERPAVFPPRIPVVEGIPLERRQRDRLLMFGLALIGFVVLSFRGAPIWWLLAVGIWPLLTGVRLFEALQDSWPPGMQEVSLVRGIVATVAAAALLRETFGPLRFPAERRIVYATLGLCGVVGVLAFYNLGNPQFWHSSRGSWTFVHHLDLRQYYPTAKYFKELGYRGLYEADVAAYTEGETGASLDSLQQTPMRDLDDLQMTTVGERRRRIESIKSRFSPERWESYKRDTGYFRSAMGTSAWMDTMHDMGGNATPVWMSIAHVLFSIAPPTNGALLVTGLLDPLLLLAAFLAIGRCFGLRTMFVCMVIFGANDFIMYGSNWAGATLRHDWLAYLGLGACALKREKWVLGGVLLGLSAMIRAFPAVALMAASLPVAFYVWDQYRANKKLPTLREVRQAQRPVERMLIGALSAVVVLFAFSALVLPVEAWGDWWLKVKQLSGDPHANHISLRSLLAGWDDDQESVLRARLPLYLIVAALYLAGVVFACRGKRLEQCAVLGLVLIPVLFYPANYYIHFVFLLPLVIVERPLDQGKAAKSAPLTVVDAWIVGALLGMCALQYFTVLITIKGLHFYFGSVCLFLGLSALLVLVLRREALLMRWAMPIAGTASLSTATPPPAEQPPAQSDAPETESAPPTPAVDPSSSAAE